MVFAEWSKGRRDRHQSWQVAAVEMDQRRSAGAIANAHHLADGDDYAMALNRFHQTAIDRPHRVKQNRRASIKRPPPPAREALCALLRSLAAERVCDLDRLARQKTEGELARRRDGLQGRSALRD